MRVTEVTLMTFVKEVTLTTFVNEVTLMTVGNGSSSGFTELNRKNKIIIIFHVVISRDITLNSEFFFSTTMSKSIKKTKGHRFDKVRYHVPFYTTPFFNPDGELEEGEVSTKRASKVKIPVKITATGDESRSNVTSFEMEGISHFDNNVENVLVSISQLKERVIKPKAIEDPNEEIRVTVQLMQLICNSGPASQTLQEAARMGRTLVHDEHLKDDDNDEVVEDVLINDEAAFYEFINNATTYDNDEFDSEEEYINFMYQEFNRGFWNHLNSVIFGADAYRAFKQQKDYMLNKIVKPYGVSVEAAFRRIEIISNLLAYFPPPSSRGKTATVEQWENFQDTKRFFQSSKER
jgi:hypothetical protein